MRKTVTAPMAETEASDMMQSEETQQMEVFNMEERKKTQIR